ncbi:hypothetical protein [Nocardioides ferulae]|uniref:hypothetical protein n=1 Tax=Nocardioides ferulae TaxID=2340821 RepID=UPI000EAE1DBB|nr:hypothetical protein [Nocardioides ferulae]
MEPSGPEQPEQPGQPGQPAADLFDRWLSRTGRAEEPAAPAGESADEAVPGPPEETAEPPGPATPLVVEAPVDPLFDESFVADDAEPTVVEQVVEEALGVAPPRPAEPVTPPDFEPVLTASARRREQAAADRLRGRPDLPAEGGGGDQAADGGPEPTSRPHTEEPTEPAPAGHLDAGRAVLAELAGPPAPDAAADDDGTAAEPPAPAEEPPAPPAATPAAVTPLTTTPAADPARAVVEALDAPTPAAPAPPRPRPRQPRQPRRSGRPEAADPPAPRPGPVAPDVARAMLASSFVDREATPPAEQAETSSDIAGDIAGDIAAGDAGPSTSVPPVVEFAPRTGVRRLTAVLLLACLAATAVAGWAAYAERTELNIALAVTLGVLTLVVWGVLASTGVTRLVVRGGMLEVHRGGGRFLFDLTSRYTPVEVVGEPGRRGWKVLFLRRGMSPFVIDSSVVDPHAFMAVLRHYRPE